MTEGYIRTFRIGREGGVVRREEFVAKKIGHDLARTSSQVDRARRSTLRVRRPQQAARTWPWHTVHWNLLNFEDAAVEWIELIRWVQWRRRTLRAIGCDAGT